MYGFCVVFIQSVFAVLNSFLTCNQCFILSSILKDSKVCTDFEFGLYSEIPPVPWFRRKLKGTNPKSKECNPQERDKILLSLFGNSFITRYSYRASGAITY